MDPADARNPYSALLSRIGHRRRPVTNGVVFTVTAAVGIAQLVHPRLLGLGRRDAAAIDRGEWWRLLTGMFLQDGRLPGLLVNLVALALVGTAAERVFGWWKWLLLYFGCGLFGQAMSYLWLHPDGAGNSMCVTGLIGALATVVLLAARRFGTPVARQPWLTALAVPVLAVADTAVHDNHGLPALLGTALGALLLPAPAAPPETPVRQSVARD
ncbi:rhomboid family intramembrane serine protease [Nocardia sp. alder85J]|uniref:rhomboid family intramembrane serine protease n=1 Tax=Nocardia sp. alder85J TaxID=2862949 RepID=UPI001CD1D472|nr:rhomboid family intramembrane serine protease [Nocardia sp. alder85J]MCX4097050.1 rhomboid family intramembrane serine protease [Nocardia sp. alder85J]